MNIKNNSYWLVVCVTIALGLVAVLLGGCGKKEVSPQGGVISEVTMAAAVDSNDRPLQPTGVFTVDTEAFYCSLRLSHFPPGTKIKAEWIFVGGETMIGIAENTVLASYIGTPEGDGYTSVTLERPDLAGVKWPKGDYKVVFSVEGDEKGSASFKVE
ncbi:MAG: hypothetical protein NTW48_03930 [Chloroflexi bacterium]|nr:hypothetical protein [Chloroflexota bacterium]